MRPGIAISGVTHALVLGWGLVLFAVTPVEAPKTEAMPVDLVPISKFTELKAGTLKKTNVEEPNKQVAEKIAEPKPAPPTEAKPADKPEIKPQAAAPPPPPPSESLEKLIDKMVTPEPAPAQQVRVPEPPKRPPIPKQQPKPPEATADARMPQRTFDPNRVAALLDKRDPTRPLTAAPEVSPQATLGAPIGTASMLSMSEIDALRRHIESCWNLLPSAGNADHFVVDLKVRFNRDGTIRGQPEVLNRSSHPAFQAIADTAVRALLQCQPYTMLSPAKYDVWKDLDFGFYPPDNIKG